MVNGNGNLRRKRHVVFMKRQTINYLKLARSTVFALIQNAFKTTQKDTGTQVNNNIFIK